MVLSRWWNSKKSYDALDAQEPSSDEPDEPDEPRGMYSENHTIPPEIFEPPSSSFLLFRRPAEGPDIPMCKLEECYVGSYDTLNQAKSAAFTCEQVRRKVYEPTPPLEEGAYMVAETEHNNLFGVRRRSIIWHSLE